VKFFLDHDVPAVVKDALERHEHDAIRLTDLLPRTAPDDDVFTTAQRNQCVMITCNRDDFLKLAAKGPHLGLVILIRRRSPQAECTNLLRLVRRAGEQGLRGQYQFRVARLRQTSRQDLAKIFACRILLETSVRSVASGTRACHAVASRR